MADEPPPLRILVINANTSSFVTEKLLSVGRATSPPGVQLVGATARFGAAYISSRTSAAVAGHAVLDAYAAAAGPFDAVYLGCFGDPGLLALRELSEAPVVGMAEASCHAACQIGQRFSIVTGGERWPAMLREFVHSIGLQHRLASVRAVQPTGLQIAANPDAALAELAAACRAAFADDGADCVVLAGAGLAGIAPLLAPQLDRPVICSVEAGWRQALATAGSSVRKARAGTFAAPPPVASVGLSPELQALLTGQQ